MYRLATPLKGTGEGLCLRTISQAAIARPIGVLRSLGALEAKCH
jgi:hypothetical protein